MEVTFQSALGVLLLLGLMLSFILAGFGGSWLGRTILYERPLLRMATYGASFLLLIAAVGPFNFRELLSAFISGVMVLVWYTFIAGIDLGMRKRSQAETPAPGPEQKPK